MIASHLEVKVVLVLRRLEGGDPNLTKPNLNSKLTLTLNPNPELILIQTLTLNSPTLLLAAALHRLPKV